jgi:hypothetical protein
MGDKLEMNALSYKNSTTGNFLRPVVLQFNIDTK